MPISTVTGNDTLTLNGHVFNDLAAGDTTVISYPNELITRKTGKNGNTMYAENAAGLNADLTLRLLRGSTDDQYMQNLLSSAPADFPSTVLFAGTFVKRLGDGQGNVISDVIRLAGGVIARNVDTKENVDGDTTQAETVYSIKFASAQRQIG